MPNKQNNLKNHLKHNPNSEKGKSSTTDITVTLPGFYYQNPVCKNRVDASKSGIEVEEVLKATSKQFAANSVITMISGYSDLKMT
jgi:hypothetical protein